MNVLRLVNFYGPNNNYCSLFLLTAAILSNIVPVGLTRSIASIRMLIDILRPIGHNPEKKDQKGLLNHLYAPFLEVPLPVPPIIHIR